MKNEVRSGLSKLNVVLALALLTTLLLWLANSVQTQAGIEQALAVIGGMTLMATFAALNQLLEPNGSLPVRTVSSDAGFEIATANYEISSLIHGALSETLNALNLDVLTPDQAIAAANAIQRVNQAQEKLVVELVKRLQPKGGREKLSLTENDKSFLTGLTKLLADTVTELDHNPAILALDSGITAKVLAIKPVAMYLVSLMQNAPAVESTGPSLLWLQLPRATGKAGLGQLTNEQLFAQIYTEARAVVGSEGQLFTQMRMPHA